MKGYPFRDFKSMALEFDICQTKCETKFFFSVESLTLVKMDNSTKTKSFSFVKTKILEENEISKKILLSPSIDNLFFPISFYETKFKIF